MLKQTKSLRSKYIARASFHSLMIAALGLSLVAGWFMAPLALADRFDDQIRDLNSQNSQNYSALKDLEDQASSYQQVIDGLQAQIQGIQKQITANIAQQARLQTEINETQAQLDQQKKFLGDSVKSMYVNDNLTTVEMLATSKNLSDFVDSETYRSAVQAKIQATLKQITALQNKLKDQKNKVDQLLVQQKQQRSDLNNARAEQAHLLALNQDQQNAYNKKIKDNQSKIADLRAQQAIENSRLFGGGGTGTVGGGGYPWGNAACLATGNVSGSCPGYEWGYNGSYYNWDTGGYAYRNCTDWVAWRGGFPGGLGNANSWDDRAYLYGLSTSSTPHNGNAAVSNAGTYGHVMYVEHVNGDGSIFISEYNGNGLGTYRTNTLQYVSTGKYRNPSTGAISTLVFVSH